MHVSPLAHPPLLRFRNWIFSELVARPQRVGYQFVRAIPRGRKESAGRCRVLGSVFAHPTGLWWGTDPSPATRLHNPGWPNGRGASRQARPELATRSSQPGGGDACGLVEPHIMCCKQGSTLLWVFPRHHLNVRHSRGTCVYVCGAPSPAFWILGSHSQSRSGFEPKGLMGSLSSLVEHHWVLRIVCRVLSSCHRVPPKAGSRGQV